MTDGDNEEGYVENDDGDKDNDKVDDGRFCLCFQSQFSEWPSTRHALRIAALTITISCTKVCAHRTTKRATTNQNPRTSRRRSTFGLPSNSESDVGEPPIDPELELSSHSVISGESDSAPGQNRSHRREAEYHTPGNGHRETAWHDSKISRHFLREACAATNHCTAIEREHVSWCER